MQRCPSCGKISDPREIFCGEHCRNKKIAEVEERFSEAALEKISTFLCDQVRYLGITSNQPNAHKAALDCLKSMEARGMMSHVQVQGFKSCPHPVPTEDLENPMFMKDGTIWYSISFANKPYSPYWVGLSDELAMKILVLGELP
jgi:hypothetical protein